MAPSFPVTQASFRLVRYLKLDGNRHYIAAQPLALCKKFARTQAVGRSSETGTWLLQITALEFGGVQFEEQIMKRPRDLPQACRLTAMWNILVPMCLTCLNSLTLGNHSGLG